MSLASNISIRESDVILIIAPLKIIYIFYLDTFMTFSLSLIFSIFFLYSDESMCLNVFWVLFGVYKAS